MNIVVNGFYDVFMHADVLTKMSTSGRFLTLNYISIQSPIKSQNWGY